ncbi:MAG: four helix bundle protein [Bacteroidales bacterium]|nr:four helix bundle protein [Lentimicrobiaceae bacterium]MDD5694117.1 four helix bundle protein [Bacteroidales bacterium]
MSKAGGNIIKDKSFEFAIEVVKLYKTLVNEKREFILSRQFLKSGTSIGANVREADNAESKPDFIHKMGIAQKEADETLYWLDLIRATEYVDQICYDKLKASLEEIIRIIKSIILTSKESLKK